VSKASIPLSRFGLIEVVDHAAALAHCRRTFPEVVNFAFKSKSDTSLQSVGVDLGKVRISTAHSTGHLISLADDHRVTVLIPFRRAISVSSKRREERAVPGGIIVTDVGPRDTEVTEGYCGGVIKIPKQQVIRSPGRLPVLHDLNGQDHASRELESLRRYSLFLFDELEKSDVLTSHKRAGANCAALLADLVCLAFLDFTDPIENARHRTASLRQVERAEQQMREKLGEAVSILDIAESLEISVRALELAFRRHRQTSPKQFLSELRLEEINRRLAAASITESVGSIAFECGVAHLGRFSNRYRQRFNEMPSDTLRRAKRGA
jgi:AraC-like DNA-binding protein